MAKASEIMELLGTYLLAFPQSKMTDEALILYSKALTDYNILQLEAAMKKLSKTSDFFPSLAAICRESEKVEAISRDQQEMTAAEAWEEAMSNARSIGPYSSEQWHYSSPAVEQAVKLFGGRECFYNLESDNINTARAQFRDIYNSIVNKEKDRKQTMQAIRQLGPAKVQVLMAKIGGAKEIAYSAN